MEKILKKSKNGCWTNDNSRECGGRDNVMKNVASVFLLCVLLSCVGCGLTSNERIKTMQAAVETYQQESESLSADVLDIKAAVIEMQKLLDDPAIDTEQVAKIQEQIDKAMATAELVLAKKVEVDAAIDRWKVQIDEALEGNATIGTELELWSQAAGETAPLVPGPIGLVIGIIGLVLGTAGRIAQRRTKAAATGIVASLDSTIRNLPEEAKATIKSTMPTDAKKLVRELKPL